MPKHTFAFSPKAESILNYWAGYWGWDLDGVLLRAIALADVCWSAHRNGEEIVLQSKPNENALFTARSQRRLILEPEEEK